MVHKTVKQRAAMSSIEDTHIADDAGSEMWRGKRRQGIGDYVREFGLPYGGAVYRSRRGQTRYLSRMKRPAQTAGATLAARERYREHRVLANFFREKRTAQEDMQQRIDSLRELMHARACLHARLYVSRAQTMRYGEQANGGEEMTNQVRGWRGLRWSPGRPFSGRRCRGSHRALAGDSATSASGLSSSSSAQKAACAIVRPPFPPPTRPHTVSPVVSRPDVVTRTALPCSTTVGGWMHARNDGWRLFRSDD